MIADVLEGYGHGRRNADRNVIDEEVRRFDALGDDWWDPNGPMAPLHRLNPTRLAWLRDTIAAHVRHSGGGDEPPLAGLSLLDVGCGGGLLSEPLSRLGAEVVGLDPAPTSIEIARAHAAATGARVSYRVGTVEDLAKEGKRFDVVLAMEVVEHVADVRRLRRRRRLGAETRRPLRRRDAQPHPEELRAGDPRR